MPYPEEMVSPMRAELTSNGFVELKTADEVDKVFSKKSGTALLLVNSVCGCAAGQARPGVLKAVADSPIKPDQLTTVFAGQDTEATEKARSFIAGYPPSSPAVALFKDGELVFMMERMHIENRNAEMVADILKDAFSQFLS